MGNYYCSADLILNELAGRLRGLREENTEEDGTMKQNDIEDVVRGYISEMEGPHHRYASFDYCYNYFQGNRNKDLTADMEKACLELAFYLASWGMLRGSSQLLQKSARNFKKTIEYINSLDKNLWEIDVDDYDDVTIDLLINTYNEIKGKVIEEQRSSMTLVTKIMLGIFGSVPAYDSNFCEGFRKISNGECGFRSFNKKSLETIKQFYDTNKTSIDRLSNETYTYDFSSGEKTSIKYPKAKIIDMYGFALASKK
jgi:hypothetical protein